MVARYIHDLFVPPSNLGLSKVSHRLRLSRREKIGLCLKLSFFFLACFAILSLFVTVISSLARFPVLSRDEYHGRGVTFGFNTLSTVDNTSLSSLWAYNSPYHPAGEYEGSIREGCVVTQVNIVSSFPLAFHRSQGRLTYLCATPRSFNATEPDTRLLVQLKKLRRHSRNSKLQRPTAIIDWIFSPSTLMDSGWTI